jgi:hypothetical protein
LEIEGVGEFFGGGAVVAVGEVGDDFGVEADPAGDAAAVAVGAEFDGAEQGELREVAVRVVPGGEVRVELVVGAFDLAAEAAADLGARVCRSAAVVALRSRYVRSGRGSSDTATGSGRSVSSGGVCAGACSLPGVEGAGRSSGYGSSSAGRRSASLRRSWPPWSALTARPCGVGSALRPSPNRCTGHS